jgi:hypothetical protein
VSAAGLQDGKLAPAIDIQIGLGIGHRVDVTQSAGQVEHDLLTFHEMVHRELITDVGHVHGYTILEAGNIEKVATIVGDQ